MYTWDLLIFRSTHSLVSSSLINATHIFQSVDTYSDLRINGIDIYITYIIFIYSSIEMMDAYTNLSCLCYGCQANI